MVKIVCSGPDAHEMQPSWKVCPQCGTPPKSALPKVAEDMLNDRTQIEGMSDPDFRKAVVTILVWLVLQVLEISKRLASEDAQDERAWGKSFSGAWHWLTEKPKKGKLL